MGLHRWLRIDIGVPLLDTILQPHGGQCPAPHAEITVLLIRGRAEQDLPATDIRLPDKHALLIRIERPDDAGFLPGHNQVLTIRQVHQHYAR
jgi:hypothetical protein